MPTKYYKTENAATLEAWRTYLSEVEAVRDAGEGFAETFGATPLFGNDVHGYSFCGITFKGGEPLMGSALWTKPETKNLGRQNPRKKVPAALREESKKLHTMWNEGYPKIKADREPLLQSLGLSWSSILFGGGFKFFELEGVAYFATSATLKEVEGITEITGSEFEQREDQHSDNSKKAA